MKLLAVAIFLVGLLSALDLAVKQVPIENVPEFCLPWWNYIVAFFSSVPWIAMIGIGRNVWGYLRNYWWKEGGATYNFKQLKTTLAMYIGLLTTIQAIGTYLPDPYGTYFVTICTAIIVVLDLALSEIAHMQAGTR